MKSNRLDKVFGDGIIKRIIDQRIELAGRRKTSLTEEEYREYKERWDRIINAEENLTAEEKAEYIALNESMLRKYLYSPGKTKAISQPELAVGPNSPYKDGQQVTYIKQEYISDVSSWKTTFRCKYNRPTSYPARQLYNITAEWDCQDTAWVSTGNIFMVANNNSCWDDQFQTCRGGVWTQTYDNSGRIGSHNFGTVAYSETTTSGSQWVFNADFSFWAKTSGGETFEIIEVDWMSCGCYQMGGRGDVYGDGIYDSNDQNRMLDIYEDTSLTTEYEYYSRDAIVDSNFDIYDLVKMVYILNDPCNGCPPDN